MLRMPMGVQIGDNIIDIEARKKNLYLKKQKQKHTNKKTANVYIIIDFTCWVED